MQTTRTDRLFAADSKFGDLMDYYTAEYIRPATKAERAESRDAGDAGVINVDGRSCYVQE